MLYIGIAHILFKVLLAKLLDLLLRLLAKIDARISTNLYAGQKATVRTGHGTTDWFQIGKGIRQGCILSPCLFNLICRVHHEKRWAGRRTSWNQDCWEKYQ